MPLPEPGTSVPPLASWNADRDLWETIQQASLFSEHLDVYSETWPTSGSMRNGTAYERPTSALPTAAPGTSSSPSPVTPPAVPKMPAQGALLPTPSASLGVNGGSQPPDKRRAGGHSVQLHDVIEHL